MAQAPILFKALYLIPINVGNKTLWYQFFILLFTFVCYTTYHLSRKPISVVKTVLHQNCSEVAQQNGVIVTGKNDTFCDWPPFDQENYTQLLGSLEYAYLFAYAVGMLISGHIAERMNLRHYLGIGMLLSGVTTALFGLGFFLKIHRIEYYLLVQIFGGLVQATGWPSVVACVGNWFGKGKRGFIMGVWNSHTSVGNILGSVIAGVFVQEYWGLSFIVPGAIIFFFGCLCLLLLIPYPTDVGLSSPHETDVIRVTEVDMLMEVMVESVTPSTVDINEFAGRTINNDIRLPLDDPTEQLPQQQPENNSFDSSKDGTPQREAAVNLGSVDTDPLLPRLARPTLDPSSSSADMGSKKAIGLLAALRIPGVIEYSLCLFFAKLVSYTFLYWLPNYISHSSDLNSQESAYLSTLFDFGGIIGGILAGVISDVSGRRGLTCMLMLLMAAPMLLVYKHFGTSSWSTLITLLIITGGLVNGPYALITTAVSADLGTSVKGDKALATVTAIIDGTGSMGAAFGPLLTGIIVAQSWDNVFYMLVIADLSAFLLLLRVGLRELSELVTNCRIARSRALYEGLDHEA